MFATLCRQENNLTDRSNNRDLISSTVFLPFPEVVGHQTDHFGFVAESRFGPADQAVYRIGLDIGHWVVVVFEQVIPATVVSAVAEFAMIEMLDVPRRGGDPAFCESAAPASHHFDV